MADSIRNFIHFKQPNNPNNENIDINVGFTSNTKFILLHLRKLKFYIIPIQTLQ